MFEQSIKDDIHKIAMTPLFKKNGEIGYSPKKGEIKFFLDRAGYHAEIVEFVVSYMIHNNITILSMTFNIEEFNMTIEIDDLDSYVVQDMFEDLIPYFNDQGGF